MTNTIIISTITMSSKMMMRCTLRGIQTAAMIECIIPLLRWILSNSQLSRVSSDIGLYKMKVIQTIITKEGAQLVATKFRNLISRGSFRYSSPNLRSMSTSIANMKEPLVLEVILPQDHLNLSNS